MKLARFADFEDGLDLDGVGFTADDLDLSISAINLDDPGLSPFGNCYRRYRDPKWFHTTPSEELFCDVPLFDTLEDRATWFIARMCRAYLDVVGGDENAKVFSYSGELVSMVDLLDMFTNDPLKQIMKAVGAANRKDA